MSFTIDLSQRNEQAEAASTLKEGEWVISAEGGLLIRGTGGYSDRVYSLSNGERALVCEHYKKAAETLVRQRLGVPRFKFPA